jgi:hypothetical protein
LPLSARRGVCRQLVFGTRRIVKRTLSRLVRTKL